MYSLFNEDPPGRTGEVTFPEFMYARRGLLREKSKIINYYQKNPKYLKSQHFLVRLIQSITVPFGNDLRVYFDKVSDLTPRLSRSFKMTSPVSKGDFFKPGIFYGKNTKEVIIVTEEEFDLHKDWKTYRPVEVLRHDFTSLAMRLPNGDTFSDKESVAVLKLNIPMLAVMHRRWREDSLLENPDSPGTIMQFINRYVLPNIIHSHLDMALFNRFIVGEEQSKREVSKRAHPFYVTDYTSRVDRLMKKQRNIVRKRKRQFLEILTNLPAVDSKNYLEFFRLPDLAPTRQVEWALIYARAPVVAWLVRLNDEMKNRRNRKYTADIKRSLREIRSDKTLRNVLGREENDQFERYIKEEIEPYV